MRASTAKDFLTLVTDPALRKQIKRRIANAAKRSSGSELDYPKLAGMVSGQIHIRDAPPLIFHPEVAREPDFMARLEAVIATYRETLPDERRALLDRYRLVDAAIKVVGIGSVGRRCWIGLFMSAGNDPLFLQFKEACASVLEPYAGRSAYSHHGQRVVIGQRLMQPASDVFLALAQRPGWEAFLRRASSAMRRSSLWWRRSMPKPCWSTPRLVVGRWRAATPKPAIHGRSAAISAKAMPLTPR